MSTHDIDVAGLIGQTAMVSRHGAGVRFEVVTFASADEVDKFWERVVAERLVVAQSVPPDEHLVCSVTRGGGRCGQPATHAVIEAAQVTGGDFDQVTCCLKHLADAATLVLYGPDTSAPRPAWN